MAKVLLGVLVSDVRNKIGGVVFAKSRSGLYVRRKVSPIQPRTIAQQAIRSGLSGFAKNWGGGLSPTERAAWVSFAQAFPTKDKFGQTIVLTGEQMYVRLNQVISDNSGTPIDTPPVNLNVTGLTALTISAVAATPLLNITAFSPALVTNEKLQVSATRPLSPGRAYLTTFFRVIKYALTGGAPPLTLATEYAAKFGAWVAGQRMSISVRVVNTVTGAESRPISATVIST